MSILDDLANLPDDASDSPMPKPEFSFQDLLKEAVAHKAEGEQLKAVRKAVKSGENLSAEDALSLRRMENNREWLARASVAMFQVQHCTCCENYNPVLLGLFQRQVSRFTKGISRWIAAEESENYGLVKEVKTNEVDVPFCAQCLDQWDFPAEQLGIVFDGDDSAEDSEEEEASLEDLFAAEFAAMQMDLPFDTPTVEPPQPDWDTKADNFESREQDRQRRAHALTHPEEAEE